MAVLAKSTFWVVTFGTIGYCLLNLCKPEDQVIAKYQQEAKFTDAAKNKAAFLKVLQDAAQRDSEVTKKVNDLLKK